MGVTDVVHLAMQVAAGEKSRTDALSEHFSRNFYRPLSEKWLPVALSILERFETNDDLSYEVDNPMADRRDPVRNKKIRADKIVEDLHLTPFLPGEIEFGTAGSFLSDPELN